MRNLKYDEKVGDYQDWLIESLRDPIEAAAYLQVAFDEFQEDANLEYFLLALRNVAKAYGGLGKLAKKADLNRQNLYRALSSNGNPKLETFGALLHSMGFHMTIKPLPQDKTSHHFYNNNHQASLW